ncbi:MAG: YigZ family protein [Candidatus Aegiribacteria sp.]|nr:YigZ family protein [Candidatus Aegiribacteria sp.]
MKGPKTKAGACRFAARGVRLISEQEPAKALEELVRHCRMRKASHISWACRLTLDGKISEMKGDGGESGAGSIILNVLRKSSAENVLIAVAR